MESFLFAVAKETLEKLRSSGCVEYVDDDETGSVQANVLGTAAANFYLNCQTPKQMEFGVKEALKMVLSCLEQNSIEHDSSNDARQTLALRQLVRSARVDEVSLSWLLYSVCSTHEFDEHPVRHNEEFLNEELSEQLVWGADTSGVLAGSGGSGAYHSIEIFQDPHTKCFLLVQAHLQRARLPISDYVNDTKMLVENVPRLLAAMQYIAAEQFRGAAGSFELLTQFSRSRQYFETRSLVKENPMLQLPGISADIVKRLKNVTKSKDAPTTIFELRSLARQETATLLKRLQSNKTSSNFSVDEIVGTLYAVPLFQLLRYKVRSETEKSTGKTVGCVHLELQIHRDTPQRKNAKLAGSLSWTILLGTYQQKFLLSQSSLRVNRFGRWTISKELKFPWDVANADGGVDGGKMILRLLAEEVRGFDLEITVNLK